MSKKLLVTGIILISLVVGFSGCTEKIIEGTGKIQFNDFEGGFYGIVSDDGKHYDPVNLPDEFKEDALRVSFELVILKKQASIHQWGQIVRIINIEKL